MALINHAMDPDGTVKESISAALYDIGSYFSSADSLSGRAHLRT